MCKTNGTKWRDIENMLENTLETWGMCGNPLRIWWEHIKNNKNPKNWFLFTHHKRTKFVFIGGMLHHHIGWTKILFLTLFITYFCFINTSFLKGLPILASLQLLRVDFFQTLFLQNPIFHCFFISFHIVIFVF